MKKSPMVNFCTGIFSEKVIIYAMVLFGIFSWTIYSNLFIWDDSYFYLVVSRNLSLHGGQTFSNVFPTNGFHPLWLYLLTAYSYIVSIVDTNALFHPAYAVPLSAAVLAWGVINFWKIASLLALPKVLFISIPLTYLLFFPVLYSEAHLYYATLSFLTLISVDNKKYGNPYLAGIACALVFLSRLDSVFIIFCYLLWYAYTTRNVARLLRLCIIFSLLVVPYLLSNLFYFGSIIPMSGWVKSSFPAICFNPTIGANSLFGYNIAGGILPIFISLLILSSIRKTSVQSSYIVYVYLFGSLLHCIYTILFTRYHFLFWWYYIPHIMLLAFSISLLVKQWTLSKFISEVLTAMLIIIFCTATVRIRWKDWSKRGANPVAKILAYMEQNDFAGKTILVSEYPGIIAFYSRANVIAADMLTSNRNFFDAMRHAPDAITYLREYCMQSGKPLEYYLHMGGWFITLNRKATSITYYDPKSYPVLKPIGRLIFGDKHEYGAWWTYCILWKLTNAREGDNARSSLLSADE